MKILELSATELAKKIKAGEITSEEAAKASLAQIAKEDQKIRAYLTVDEEKVLARAKEVDNGIRSGKYTGPLAGVPIAVKDNICTKDMRTTCASKILENFVPFYDATAVTRITDAGMVILGKTNMDEFAMGSTTETSAFAVTKNPWDTEHVPGGSSGGSCGKPRHNQHKKYPAAQPRDTFLLSLRRLTPARPFQPSSAAPPRRYGGQRDRNPPPYSPWWSWRRCRCGRRWSGTASVCPRGRSSYSA